MKTIPFVLYEAVCWYYIYIGEIIMNWPRHLFCVMYNMTLRSKGEIFLKR